MAQIQQQQFDFQRVQEDGGGGILGAIGGALKVAAPFAALIPGVGLPLAIGLGAAGAAAGSALQGGGVEGAVAGAAGGGLGAIGMSMGVDKKRDPTSTEMRFKMPDTTAVDPRRSTPGSADFDYTDFLATGGQDYDFGNPWGRGGLR